MFPSSYDDYVKYQGLFWKFLSIGGLHRRQASLYCGLSLTVNLCIWVRIFVFMDE